MYNTEFGPAQNEINPSEFQHVKWRRRGKDRRLDVSGSSIKREDYAEKRSSGDRRHHLLELISKFIFPRGKDGF